MVVSAIGTRHQIYSTAHFRHTMKHYCIQSTHAKKPRRSKHFCTGRFRTTRGTDALQIFCDSNDLALS